jgi:Co/Zn/Cd efflux system component
MLGSSAVVTPRRHGCSQGVGVSDIAAELRWKTGSRVEDLSALNLQGALRHIIADLLGSVGVIAAALVILLTGWVYADPLISVLIGFLVLGSSCKLLRDSTNILLERARAV